MSECSRINAVSLFSSMGVGEFYLDEIGIDVVVSNEIDKNRAEAHKIFYPKCEVVNSDITQAETQKYIIKICKEKQVELLIATPPCQGVSSVGSNRKEETFGKDPRNYLILSAINIIDSVSPKYVIIENVPRYKRMRFPFKEKFVTLDELLKLKYKDIYEIKCEIFNAADYGVAQTRHRVVYRMWKKGLHWEDPLIVEKPLTLREAIGDLPTLEAGEESNIKNHYARKHPEHQVVCMRHTPTGLSAFKNDYYYPKKADGSRIKGYGNTYKRMRWDVPAPTITMRNEIISSQENVHPGRLQQDGTWSDARVLTLRELLIVSSLPPDLDQPSCMSETSFRQIIGEGIPPLLMKKIMKGIF